MSVCPSGPSITDVMHALPICGPISVCILSATVALPDCDSLPHYCYCVQ